MKKLLSRFALLALALFLQTPLSLETSAQQIPKMEFYHGAECPHCHEEKKFFPTLKQMYPDLQIETFEIWHNPENKLKAEKRMAELGQKLEGVPTNIIANEVVVGFQKEKILELLQKHYGAPQSVTDTPLEHEPEESSLSKIIIGLVLAGVLIGTGLFFGRKN